MASENPVHMLIHEHKYILKVVNSTAVLDACLEKGEPIDVEMVRKIVHFMREFADKCHHGKEEQLLFPAMEKKGVPETGCPLGGLMAEHKKGRSLVAALDEAAGIYAASNAEGASKIREAMRGIRELYPNHIWKEDAMVFPMAERLFTVEELAQMKADFDQVELELGQHHDALIAFADEMEGLLQKTSMHAA
jgi:hemerythrin-like domain-containing protein